MSMACIKYAEVYEYTSSVYNIPNLFLDLRVKSILTKINLPDIFVPSFSIFSERIHFSPMIWVTADSAPTWSEPEWFLTRTG